MKDIINKSNFIIREEGLRIYLSRLSKVIIVKMRRRFRNNTENIDKWKGIKNIYNGNRVFLIGNGPSLNKLPLHQLKNEYTMCFNRFNLMFERLDWTPTMFCTIDDRVLSDMVPEINEMTDIFKFLFLPDLHPYNINFKKHIIPKENIFWLYLEKLPFSIDLPFCGINKTVTNVALQILAFLGFKEIYLIGVDFNYFAHETVKKANKRDLTSTNDDDPNHFDPRYFGKGRKYHTPRMEESLLRYQEGKAFFDSLGVKIFNAGLDSKLDVFPKVDFRSLFKYSNSDEFHLIVNLIKNNFNIEMNLKEEKFDKILPGSINLKDENEFNKNMKIIMTNINVALKLIPRIINSHIPIGPVNNIYFFISRNLKK